MKRLLLSLLTILSISPAWADEVTTTDLSEFEDVIYMQNTTALQGTTSVTIPINIKAHDAFTGYDFCVILPTGARMLKLNAVYSSRYNADSPGFQSIVHSGNDQVDGSYAIAGALISGGTIGGVEYDKDFLTAEDGEFCSINIDVSSLDVGEYPLTIAAHTGMPILSGFSDGSKDVTLENSIVTKLVITDRVTLDENSTTAPVAMTGVNVTVKRTIYANEWSTICLPFEISSDNMATAFGDGITAELANFTGYEETYDAGEKCIAINVKFESVSRIEANHPYIIKVNKDVSEIKVDAVDITPEADNAVVKYDNGLTGKQYALWGTFSGTYVAGTTIPENNLFISGNTFYYSKGVTVSKAYRGYFWFIDELADKTKTSSAKIDFSINADATGIEDLHTIARVEGIYDLSGRKIKLDGDDLSRLPKGVYIMDGKKVTVK